MSVETKTIKLANTWSSGTITNPIVVTNPIPVTTPNTPVQDWIDDCLTLKDQTIYVPCYDKNAYYEIPVGTIIEIETDDYDEAIYYENLKLDNLKVIPPQSSDDYIFSLLKFQSAHYIHSHNNPDYYYCEVVDTRVLYEESGNYVIDISALDVPYNIWYDVPNVICLTPVKTITFTSSNPPDYQKIYQVLFTPDVDFVRPDDWDTSNEISTGFVPGDGKAYALDYTVVKYNTGELKVMFDLLYSLGSDFVPATYE